MKFLMGLSLILLLITACEKERELAKKTGEIPKQIINNTVNKVNELNSLEEQKIRLNADPVTTVPDANAEVK